MSAFDDCHQFATHTNCGPYRSVDRDLTGAIEWRRAIPVKGGDLVVGTSARQFMGLATNVVNAGEARSKLSSPWSSRVLIRIFAPGPCGRRMIGMEIDEDGARPESLESAIRAGATAVLPDSRPTILLEPPGRRAASGVGRCAEPTPACACYRGRSFGDIAGGKPDRYWPTHGSRSCHLYKVIFQSIAPI